MATKAKHLKLTSLLFVAYFILEVLLDSFWLVSKLANRVLLIICDAAAEQNSWHLIYFHKSYIKNAENALKKKKIKKIKKKKSMTTNCTSITMATTSTPRHTPHLLVLFLLSLQRFASLLQQFLFLSQSLRPPTELHLFIQKLRLKAPKLLLRVHRLFVIQRLFKKNKNKKAFMWIMFKTLRWARLTPEMTLY